MTSPWGHCIESHLHLCSDDHRRRVWRQPGQRSEPVFTIASYTDPQQGVMTVFGYIVVESSDKFEEKSYCGLAINSEINSDSLNQQSQAFRESEMVDESSKEHSLEEEICETQYQNTHYRTEEGRYVVQLPIKKRSILFK
ncbi:hypothetical protein TNCV_2810601 [Trichonephila clavipes]|nr:hypothetical protein TNCV_2810601 [Trichonephila clavipes]